MEERRFAPFEGETPSFGARETMDSVWGFGHGAGLSGPGPRAFDR